MKKIDDDNLGAVSGGVQTVKTKSDEKRSFCARCEKETMFKLGTGGRAICEECGNEKLM